MVEIYVTYTCFIYAAHMSTYMKCFNLIYIPHKCHIQHIYCHICNICTLTWLIILHNIHLAYMWMSTYIRNICYFFICHIYVFFRMGRVTNLHTSPAYCCRTTLRSAKSDFSTRFNSNFDQTAIFFQKFPNICTNMQSSVLNNDKCQWLTSTRYSECSTSKYTNGTIEFVYAPLLDQVIHSALLEWSLSEPSAGASLAEWGHVNHLTVTKACKEPGPWFTLLKWLILRKFLKIGRLIESLLIIVE